MIQIPPGGPEDNKVCLIRATPGEVRPRAECPIEKSARGTCLFCIKTKQLARRAHEHAIIMFSQENAAKTAEAMRAASADPGVRSPPRATPDVPQLPHHGRTVEDPIARRLTSMDARLTLIEMETRDNSAKLDQIISMMRTLTIATRSGGELQVARRPGPR